MDGEQWLCRLKAPGNQRSNKSLLLMTETERTGMSATKPRLALLAKDTLVYGAGTILLRATALVTMPVFTRVFTPEDYGVWSVVTTTAGFLGVLLLLGGDNAYVRFFFEAKTLRERQLLTSTWFAFLFAWSWTVVILGIVAADPISQLVTGTSEHGFLMVLALLTAPLTMINAMCGQVLRNQFRAALFSVLTLLTVLLTVAFSLFAVVVLKLGVAGAIGGTLAAALVLLPLRLWTARSMVRPVFSARLLPSLLGFGVPFVPAGIAYGIFTTSDRIMLSRLSNLEQVGLYSVAASLVGVMVLARSALGQAWSPHAIMAYEEQRDAAPAFLGQASTYILVGFSLLAVAISAFAREVLVVLATPPFYAAALVAGPLALGSLASGSTQITALGLGLAKRTYFMIIYAWLAAGLNVGLNFLFIPRWGMMAAAWTTLASYLFLTLAYGATSQRLFPVAYEKRKVLALIALTVPFCLAPRLLPELPLIASIPLKAGYGLAYVASLFALGIIGKREIVAARAFLSAIKLRRSTAPAADSVSLS
ncbi:MAG: oligosaccharide flippase family protein [Chloroflexi bacterium]|nr:oligosaccharide flippase family protein [Chloroflexota bacterium]